MMAEYDEIYLVPKAYRQDEIGQPVECDKDLKAIQFKVGSVSRSEWTTAMQGGYEAEIMGEIFTASYNGEKEAILHERKYDIYRTFRNGDRTEIYLGTKVGVY